MKISPWKTNTVEIIGILYEIGIMVRMLSYGLFLKIFKKRKVGIFLFEQYCHKIELEEIKAELWIENKLL